MARTLVEDPDAGDMDVEEGDPTDERGPTYPGRRPRATTTVFIQTGHGLTLVTNGAPLPDGDTVDAVWDDVGGCWNPAPDAEAST